MIWVDVKLFEDRHSLPPPCVAKWRWNRKLLYEDVIELSIGLFLLTLPQPMDWSNNW